MRHKHLPLTLTVALFLLPGAPAHAWTSGLVPAFDEQAADELYKQGRDAIDDGHYDKAVTLFTKLAADAPARADALYWKAYAQNKVGQRAEALNTLAGLEQRFADSRWAKDAKALEIEIRQASGQTVSPDAQNDDEIKLLALRGLMDSAPDRALPMIQQLLAANNTAKVKERALFVLSQSGSAKAREMLAGIAKGGTGSNPDLQRRAINFLGMMGNEDARGLLADIYRASSDVAVKRAVLQSFMIAGERARLLAVAKTETSPELRGAAVQQLGVMGAHAELNELYQSETSPEVKKKILQAMFVGGNADRLIELAKTERDPELRKTAVRDLGLMNASKTGDALISIYQSDSSPEIRRAVIQGLFIQNNAHALVTLARAERSAEMKKAIVSQLALMTQSKEAMDYLAELLK